MLDKCKKLFIEVKDYSDNLLAMRDFIELLEIWFRWNKGDAKVALINLDDFGFKNEEMFVAYDDMSGSMNATIYRTSEFIELMIETLEEYDDEEYLDDFWVPRLHELIKNNDY